MRDVERVVLYVIAVDGQHVIGLLGVEDSAVSLVHGNSDMNVVTAQLNLNSSWEGQGNELDHHHPPTTSQTCRALPGNLGS